MCLSEVYVVKYKMRMIKKIILMRLHRQYKKKREKTLWKVLLNIYTRQQMNKVCSLGMRHDEIYQSGPLDLPPGG